MTTKTPNRPCAEGAEAVDDFTADKLADHERERAGIAGRIQDAANAGDIDAVAALQSRATALPVLIRRGVKEATAAVADAEASIAEAEAERDEAYAALESANARYQSAKEERDRLTWAAEDARELRKDGNRELNPAREKLAALRPSA